MRILFIMLLAAMQASTPPPDAPAATIDNGKVRASLYLPDAKAGYYRGARFDWSGQISSLTWNGHEYFGQWFTAYDPTLHDAIQGPVEEFLTNGDTAPGYAEAGPGGTFVRIGVGVLRKPAGETSLQRFGRYEIVDHGTWTTTPAKDRITFVHELRGPTGYAYRYTKVLRLEGDALIIEHELANTGTKPIATSVYNHNFFTLDGKNTGPDVVVRFPFAPKAARPLNLAEVRGREIAFLRELQPKENVFSEIEGFGATAADNGFEMENRATGAGVRVAGDRPLVKLLFWSAVKTACPEPYTDASVEPGRTTSWRISYTFYQANKAR